MLYSSELDIVKIHISVALKDNSLPLIYILYYSKKRHMKKSSKVSKQKSCASKKIKTVMHEWKHGKLRSHGRKVTKFKQAIAIALSMARKNCGNSSVPAKKTKKTRKT